MIRPSTSIFGIGTASLAVFCTAIILRVPSCYESFWIDELHSAWVVWDSLGDVTPRAKLGHQSPFYFVGLWFWKQIVGGGEVALRLSSILAVALSIGLVFLWQSMYATAFPMGKAGLLDPFWAAWVQNVCFGVAGLVVMYLLGFQRPRFLRWASGISFSKRH